MGVKYAVNEEFFETWSPIMAYVLGYWCADGNVLYAPAMRGKYISVLSTDETTIRKIKDYMQSEHRITFDPHSNSARQPTWSLRIGSAKLYDGLARRGVYQNKSLTIQLPVVPKNLLGDFVRGYFDGDGCVYLERGKGVSGQVIVKRLRVIFTSGSEIFLIQLHAALEEVLGNISGWVGESKRSFQLKYGTAASMQIFSLLYRGCTNDAFLKRKLDIFVNYFTIRPQRITLEIGEILRKIGYGHVVK